MLKTRRAFTLVELVVALTLTAVLGAALLAIVIRQQRFYQDVAARLAARDAVRDAVAILRGDLRAITPAAGDLYTIAPRAIDFRAIIATAVICTIDPARTTITVPPKRVTSGVPYTAWVETPRAGDTVFIYDSGLTADLSDDAWRAHVLAADPVPGASCPASTGFTTGAESARGWSMSLDSPLEPGVAAGAPLRAVRRSRYELYRAGDGRWYLGFVDCLASRVVPCATVQPVSGPYPAAGLRLEYRDAAGNLTADPARVARIEISAAARAPGAATPTDSLATTIALRN